MDSVDLDQVRCLILTGAGQKSFVAGADIAPNNPVLQGFHVDPEILYSHQTKKYYIYSTTDGQPGWGGWYFSVFSSDNLKDWKDEG